MSRAVWVLVVAGCGASEQRLLSIPSPRDQIAPGIANHTCFESASGSVRCWGTNSEGELGYGRSDLFIGDDETPRDLGDVDVGGTVVWMGVSQFDTCALLDDGHVRCWGYGYYGVVGQGNTEDIGDDETPDAVPVVRVGGTVVQLAVGTNQACALLATGAVRCWGDGGDESNGNLGYGNHETIGDDEVPADAGDLELGGRAVQISVGGAHACALLETGTVRCWGGGSHGQLGYRDTESIGDDETPASAGDVEIGGRVVELAAGGEHTCALLEGGTVRCWGYGGGGALGYGGNRNVGGNNVVDDLEALTIPEAGDLDLGGQAVQISAGQDHTCALLDTGGIRCWGGGTWGKLGYGNDEDYGNDPGETPLLRGDVDLGGASFVQVAAALDHTCALSDAGEVFCWGEGAGGALGYGQRDDVGDDEAPGVAGPVPVF